MFIVFDWHDTKAYGPFETKDGAENWLAGQGIFIGQYDDNEVTINSLCPVTDRLTEIKR